MLNNTLKRTLLTLAPELKDQVTQLEVLTEAGKQRQVMVSACGLYNAGKSSLLNALGGHVHEEYFKTANVRETCELKTLELPGLSLLDTPGLDSNSNDDTLAFEGILKSDLILLVHNPRNGELDQLELDYLGRIQAQSTEPLNQRLLLVLTYAAEINESDKTALLARIEQQFQQHFGKLPAVFWVDSPTYAKAIREEMRALASISGIEQLQGYLSENHERLAHSRQQKQQKKQELVKQTLLRSLRQEISRRENELNQQARQFRTWVEVQERRAAELQTRLAGELHG